MMKCKAITPIISILVLLLIIVTIAGASWIYMSVYFSGMTSNKIEITGAACSGNLATILLKNIGTDVISIGECQGVDNSYDCGDISLRVTQGDDSGIPVWEPQELGPGESASLPCTCAGNCQYRIIQAYGSFPVQVQCSRTPPVSGGMEGGGNLILEFNEETEPETMVMRSSPVTLTCTKKTTVSPFLYECTDGSVVVSCITYNKKRFECKITGLEIHNEVQVIGRRVDTSAPSAGKVNLNFICTPGDRSECGINIGTCRKGNRTCTANGTWGDCQGAVNPQPEICGNGHDENCNGLIDDGCTPPPANDTSPPYINAYFTRITNTSATLVVDSVDNESFVRHTGLWYNASPGHLGSWTAWGEMYYFCNNTIFCHQEHVIMPTSGPGTYKFWIRAYNRDNVWSETFLSVNFLGGSASNVTCTDSDRGLNYSLKGTASGGNGVYTDYCFVGEGPSYYAQNYTGKGVKEFFCGSPPRAAEGYVDEENHICTYGCVNGACVFNETPEISSHTCTDMDGGMDHSIRGRTIGNHSSLGYVDHTDTCISETLLKEGYCLNDWVEFDMHVCPNGCSNGTCNPVVECSDSDGGVNYIMKGTASGLNGVYTDYCFVGEGPSYYAQNYTGKGVKEFFCGSPPRAAEGYVDEENHICENGTFCQDGSCILIPDRTPPDLTPPFVFASFSHVTDYSAIINVTAFEWDSYVSFVSLQYIRPLGSIWSLWDPNPYRDPPDYPNVYNTSYSVSSINGPGFYQFKVIAYNRNLTAGYAHLNKTFTE